ncbi:hypothetical protein P4B35_04120 [Pontiellaceae bacterium B12227]|nr:hypothetical protein [Pontiellaceae bacterium B12227]
MLNSDGTFEEGHLRFAAAMGLRTYRFPGGSEGNLYHWKRGIGPVDQRIPNVSGNYRKPRTNEFGSDEFGQLLESSSFSEGIMMVAYAYEKPEDAADWVEYMNCQVGENPNGGVDWAAVRAKNGHPEPYNIRYWEIGNEVYGNWELNWGSYPVEGDAARGSANVEHDDVSNMGGILAFGDASRYVFGGTKRFTRQRAATLSSWRDEHCMTTSEKGQTFYVKFPPVDDREPFELVVEDTAWTRVDSFAKSKSKDRHYTLDPESGTILFGDGRKGALPPKGKLVYLDYTSGPQPGYVDYYKAMKAVDPSIQVISCFEKDSFYEIMAEHKLPYDGISRHYYPPAGKRIREMEPADGYRLAVSTAYAIGGTVEHHNKNLERYRNRALDKPVKLWFSEYGAHGYFGNAAVYHSLINNHSEDVGCIMIHSLFLNNRSSMYDESGLIRSKAYAIAAFSRLSSDQFVKAEVIGGDSVKSVKGGKVALPPVLVSASKSDTAREGSIILTNTGMEEAVNVKIKMKGMPLPSKEMDIWVLKPRNGNPFDENDKSNPDNISFERVGRKRLSGTMDITVPPAALMVLRW